MKKILKVVFVGCLLLLLLLTISFVYYLGTREKPETFLSDDFNVLVHVKSIKKLYNNLIDLKVTDYILSETPYFELYKYVLDFRNLEVSRNKLLLNFLELPVYCRLDTSNNVFLIADLKYASIILRFIRLDFFLKKYNVTLLSKNSYQIVINNAFFYLTLKNNLLFFSNTKENIIIDSDKSIRDNEEFLKLSKARTSSTLLDVYFRSDFIVKNARGLGSGIDNVLSRITLGRYVMLNLFLSNEDLLVTLHSQVKSDDEIINTIINKKDKSIDVLHYLPDDTNFLFKSDIGDLKSAYNFFISTLTIDKKRKLAALEKGIELLLNMTIDELLFSWPGSELGIINSDNSINPIYFLEINNNKSFKKVLNNLDRNGILQQSADIVFDGVRLSKFEFPGAMKSFINMIVKNIEMPYFIQIDNYIFLSQDPQSLSGMVNKYTGSNTLPFDNQFKVALKSIGIKTDSLVYYNTKSTRFSLFNKSEFIDKIINLYQCGIIAVSTGNDTITVSLSATGTDRLNVRTFPGFPVYSDDAITGNVIFGSVSGKKVPEIVYLTEAGSIQVKNITFKDVNGFPLPLGNDSRTITFDELNKSLTVFSTRGIVNKISKEATTIHPFPLIINYKGGWVSDTVNSKNYYFSPRDADIQSIDSKGVISRLDYIFSAPVLSQPSFSGILIALADRSISGQLFLFNTSGILQEGFPYQAGSMIKSSPVFVDSTVVFVTQDGFVHCVNDKGQSLKGWPIKLDGKYNSTPLVITVKNNKLLVILNNEGVISILNINGNVTKKMQLNGIHGNDAKLSAFDIDSDSNDEIFIYNAGNYIICLNADLLHYSGFPVSGYSKPDFIDIDRDGNFEMITSSIDSNIYIYTIMR